MSSVSLSVSLSVTLADCDHIGWKWKLVARTISPTPSLFVAQRPSTYSQGNMGKFWAVEVGWGKKSPLSLTLVRLRETETWKTLIYGAHRAVIFAIAQLYWFSKLVPVGWVGSSSNEHSCGLVYVYGTFFIFNPRYSVFCGAYWRWTITQFNKKAVLSQRWPRDASYIRMPRKFSGGPGCAQGYFSRNR